MRVGHAVGHTLRKPDNLDQHVYEGWVRIREASQSTKGIWLIVLLFVRNSGGRLYKGPPGSRTHYERTMLLWPCMLWPRNTNKKLEVLTSEQKF